MPMCKAIVQPLVLAAILTLGFGIVWGIVFFWGVETALQFGPEEESREEIEVWADGTPVITTYPLHAYQPLSARTLDGQEIPQRWIRGNLDGASLLGPPQREPWFGIDWYYRIRSFQDGGRPAAYWYFVHDGRPHGSGYFVGYDSRSKLLVGHIGLAGFRPDEPPEDQRFRVDARQLETYFGGVFSSERSTMMGWEPYVPISTFAGPFPPWIVYLVSEDTLWQVDLQKRSVRSMLTATGLLSADMAVRAIPPSAGKPSDSLPLPQQQVAVRTREKIILLDENGRECRTYRVPAAIGEDRFTFYELSDGTALVSMAAYVHGVSRHNFLWINERGEVLRSRAVELGHPSPTDNPTVLSCLFAFGMPVPAVMTPLAIYNAAAYHYDAGEAAEYPAAARMALGDVWPGLLIVGVVGVVAAWVCYRRQRQFALPWTGLWVVLVLLFGVAALAGYLFHRRWPVRQPCPDCGKAVPHDREACFACGQQFPEPAAKGIEVFA